MTWQEVAQILAVAIACGGVFRRWCLDPLNESIMKLNTMVEEQTKLIGEAQIKLAEVDQREDGTCPNVKCVRYKPESTTTTEDKKERRR